MLAMMAFVLVSASSASATTVDLAQLRTVANGTSLGPLTFTKDATLTDGRKQLRVSYSGGDIARIAATDAEWKAMVDTAKATATGSGATTPSLRYLMDVQSGWLWHGVTYKGDAQFTDGAGRLVLVSPTSGNSIVRIGALPADWDKILVTLGVGSTPPPPPPSPSGYKPPYDANSAFNLAAPSTGAGSWSSPLAQSSTWISTLSAGGAWTNDPDQYSKPIYRANLATSPLRTFRSNAYSFKLYDSGDQLPFTSSCTTCSLHIPDDAGPSSGSDGHVVLWDQANNIEYGFWQFFRSADMSVTFSNGYKTSTGAGNLGQFKDGKAGEGAGIPYLAGTVTKEDVAGGTINHALSAAVTSPGSAFVYPASKSDGGGGSSSPPEGTRLLLDPNFDESALSNPIARMMARALKTYGVYIVDGSGSNKFYMEDRQTASWPSDFTRTATSGISWSRFRAVAGPARP